MSEEKDRVSSQVDNSVRKPVEYGYPCPDCFKIDNGTMSDNFIVTCNCGCKYDGIMNTAQWKEWYGYEKRKAL